MRRPSRPRSSPACASATTIEVAAHGPGALADACAEPGCAVPPRSPPRTRSASVPRRRGHARAARAGAPARAGHRADQLLEGRHSGVPRSARPRRRARCSRRTAGRSRAAPARRACSTPPASARSRPSPTPSCAFPAMTCSWRAGVASRRASRMHVIHNGVEATAGLPPLSAGHPPRLAALRDSRRPRT